MDMANADSSAAGMPFVISTSVNKADPEMRKLIRRHCMLGRNRGRILHSRRKPKTVAPVSEAVPNSLGSELSLLRFADSVEPSTLWEVLKFISASKRIFFPLEQCFDFNVQDRSMFDPLTFDPAYLNAVMFGAQAYMDLVSGCSGHQSSAHMVKAIRLLRERLSTSAATEQSSSVSNSTILIVLTLAHVAHLTGDHDTAEHHLGGLCKMIEMRGGIAVFQDFPKLLTELIRCDISIALHRGTPPVFDFTQPVLVRVQSTFLLHQQPRTKPYFPPTPCLADGEYLDVTATHQCTNGVTSDENLAGVWARLSHFCHLVNSAADNGTKLSDRILLTTMSSVTYALLRMNLAKPDPVNEAIRLAMLAFCSHVFLERRGIHLPNGYLCDKYRTCFESLDTHCRSPRGACHLALWVLMIGKIAVYASDTTDDSAWIASRLREHVGLLNNNNKRCSWPRLRLTLKSFLWIDMLHDAPGKMIFASVS